MSGWQGSDGGGEGVMDTTTTEGSPHNSEYLGWAQPVSFFICLVITTDLVRNCKLAKFETSL
jgi:hypothetical protein